MNNGETVFIVDGDNDSRQRVCELVTSMKLQHEAYAMAQDFLQRFDPDRPGCAILEVRIPDIGGLQLQQQLAHQTPGLPVIFHSAHANVPVVVRAIKEGAVNFLQKPAEEQELWDAIQQALQLDRERRAHMADVESLHQRLEQLTEKEIEVLELLAQDKSTRVVARELGISVRTVEFRRARMIKKLGFKSPIQLSHFAIRVFDGHAKSASVAFAEPRLSNGNGNGHGSGNGHSRSALPSPRLRATK